MKMKAKIQELDLITDSGGMEAIFQTRAIVLMFEQEKKDLNILLLLTVLYQKCNLNELQKSRQDDR